MTHCRLPVSVLPADMPEAVIDVLAEVREFMDSEAPSVCEVQTKLHAYEKVPEPPDADTVVVPVVIGTVLLDTLSEPGLTEAEIIETRLTETAHVAVACCP